jgi:hypothetical protein
MASNDSVIICGLRIEHHRARHGEPAYVFVHKLGSEMRVFMAPGEARGVASALVDAANRATGLTMEETARIADVSAGISRPSSP